MNLADMLGYADIGQLGRIATTYRCECNGHSKNELIQSILQAIGRREVFEAQIGAMKLEDLRFMNSLLFDPRDTFSLEELVARVQQSKFAVEDQSQSGNTVIGTTQTTQTLQTLQTTQTAKEKNKSSGAGAAKKKRTSKATTPAPEPGPRDTIVRFKQYGWLFNGFTGPDRYLFQIPYDLKIRFREALERRFAAQLKIASEEPSAYRDEQQLLGDDVVELLTFVHHNEISLTGEGMMYKRSILQMMERFGIKEQLPVRGEWRFGYGRRMREYPDRMSFIYDYCYYNGWLAEDQMLLTLTRSGEERQHSRKTEPPDQMYRFWLRLYKNAIPNLRSLVYWTDRLAQDWVSMESLKEALLPFIRPFYYDTPAAIFEQRLVGMLLHLGLVRIGEHEELGRVIRATPLGRAVVAGLNLDDEDAIVLE